MNWSVEVNGETMQAEIEGVRIEADGEDARKFASSVAEVSPYLGMVAGDEIAGEAAELVEALQLAASEVVING